MSRIYLARFLRRFFVVVLVLAAWGISGCRTYDLSTKGVGDEATRWGAYPRPKANPLLRFGASPEARQIEESLGH